MGGNSSSNKNKQPQRQPLTSTKLELTLKKLGLTTKLNRDRRAGKVRTKEKELLYLINKVPRVQKDEYLKATGIVSDQNYVDACDHAMRFIEVLQDNSMNIIDSKGDYQKVQELIPYLISVLWVGKPLNINAYGDLYTLMMAFFGPGVQTCIESEHQVDPQLKGLFKNLMPTPGQVNNYLKTFCDKYNLDINKFNAVGHQVPLYTQGQLQKLSQQQNTGLPGQGQQPGQGGFAPGNGFAPQGGQGGGGGMGVQIPTHPPPNTGLGQANNLGQHLLGQQTVPQNLPMQPAMKPVVQNTGFQQVQQPQGNQFQQQPTIQQQNSIGQNPQQNNPFGGYGQQNTNNQFGGQPQGMPQNPPQMGGPLGQDTPQVNNGGGLGSLQSFPTNQSNQSNGMGGGPNDFQRIPTIQPSNQPVQQNNSNAPLDFPRLESTQNIQNPGLGGNMAPQQQQPVHQDNQFDADLLALGLGPLDDHSAPIPPNPGMGGQGMGNQAYPNLGGGMGGLNQPGNNSQPYQPSVPGGPGGNPQQFPGPAQ